MVNTVNNITLSTAHGDYLLEIRDSSLTVMDFLKINKIPHNSISVYFVDELGKAEIFTCLMLTLKEVLIKARFRQIVFRPDRNIDYASVIGKDIVSVGCENTPVAEYFFDAHDGSDLIHAQMDKETCKNFVNKEIGKFLNTFLSKYENKKMVIGISGGGDSNTLLNGLISQGIDKNNLIPVMMMGIPDWDKGLLRAKKICADVGLELTIVTSEEVNALLGRDSSNHDWVNDFERYYPESDLETLGTLGVRLSLTHIAKKNDTDIIVTGVNLEDVMAEGIFCLLNGISPQPYPIRKIDDVKLCFPIYRCPKRILDGCHPKFALENYNDRYPSILYWRAANYYLAQNISAMLPGMEFAFVDGLQKLSEKAPKDFHYNESLGFSIVNGTLPEHLDYWKKFIKNQ